MARARRYCIFVLLLYSQGSHGQTALNNNQNNGVNNAVGSQPQSVQWVTNNQIPNAGVNFNLPQQSNLQQPNLQLSPSSGSIQGNMQQQSNIPPNLQSQSSPTPQNNFQITKIGFTPVTPGVVRNPSNTQQLQNSGGNVQVMSNTPNQITNTPVSVTTLTDFAAIKGQPPLLSLLNSQNNGQMQQNQQVMSFDGQNQLTDAQKQFLVRSLQGSNQQGVNFVQNQPRVVNVEGQNGVQVRTIQATPQQAQAIVTPIGNQPAYITVQAQPLTTYLQNQTPQVVVEEEPSILSMILSELGPQYSISPDYFLPKKGSKTNLKSLIPLIINLLKEKNSCNCRNCCPNNGCQNNGCPNTMNPEMQMAQIFGGYSNQKMFGQDSDDTPVRTKKDDDESRTSNKEIKTSKQKTVIEDSEESEEDDSEYSDESGE